MRRALARLLLAFSVLLLLAAPLYHGLTRHYLANPDQDLDNSYIALRLVDDGTLTYFEHTGYPLSLLYAGALKVAHAVGYVESLDTAKLAAEPPETFDHAYARLVYVGRVLTLLLALAALIQIWSLARQATGNPLAAGCAAVLFGGSVGLGLQALQIRTELLGTIFLLGSLQLTLVAARRAASWQAAIALVAACGCAMLAVMTKYHFVLFVMTLPVVVWLYPPKRPAQRPARRDVLLYLATGTTLAAPATLHVLSIVSTHSTGTYQALLAGTVLALMLAYWRFHRLSPIWSILGPASVLFGLAAGYSLIFLVPHDWTSRAVLTFREYSADFIGESTRTLSNNATWQQSLHTAVLATMARYLPPGMLIGRNTLAIVAWVCVAAALPLWYRGERRAALLVGLPVLAAWVFEATHYLHGYGFRGQYRVMVEFWLILGFAHLIALLDERPQLFALPGKWVPAARAGVVLFCLAASVVHVRLILLAPSSAYTRPPMNTCFWRHRTPMLVEQLERYCTTPPRLPGYPVSP